MQIKKIFIVAVSICAFFFIAGLFEHPETPAAIRLVTSVIQSVLISTIVFPLYVGLGWIEFAE